MLYEAVCHISSAIASCEQAMDARNIPLSVQEDLRKAENLLCSAVAPLIADLAAATAENEERRPTIAEMFEVYQRTQKPPGE